MLKSTHLPPFSSPPMSADPLTDIANRDTRLKRLFAVVRQNQRAAAVLNASLPPGMAGQFRVVRIEQGEVLIFARTGGVATKLRLMSGQMVDTLRLRGLDVASLKVKVHVDTPEPVRPPKRLALSDNARAALQRAAAGIASPTLRAAMERLAGGE